MSVVAQDNVIGTDSDLNEASDINGSTSFGCTNDSGYPSTITINNKEFRFVKVENGVALYAASGTGKKIKHTD